MWGLLGLLLRLFLKFSFSLDVFLQKVFVEREGLMSLLSWLLPFGKMLFLSPSFQVGIPVCWDSNGAAVFNLFHGGGGQSVGLHLLLLPRASCWAFVT